MSNVLTPDLQDIVLTLMEGLSCPRSLQVAILVRYEEWDQLTSLEVDPKHYSNPHTYASANFATSFLKKYADFPLDLDLEAEALLKWKWAEMECYRTNERLSPLVNGSLYNDFYPDEIGNFVLSVKKVIKTIIGAGPPPFTGRFGPGATMSDTSRFTLVPDKMSSVPTMTPNAWVHLRSWSECSWGRLWSDVDSVKGNSFFTVPKTARTLRSCAKEPSLNGFYQLGLGQVIRNRLADKGINLVTGQNLHRERARESSLHDDFVTIDLTSASDTLCSNLVKLLLPHNWYEQLNSLRSPKTLVKGKWYNLEKFSSMGNGYTFELETLIFSAICLVASKRPVSCLGNDILVYGDDIIVPKESSEDVIAALKFFGFTPNPKKTFLEGPFRESCGGDFFEGVSVRAHYLKGNPNEPHKIIALANGIRRMALQNHFDNSRWPYLVRSWFKCLDLLPVTVRCCRGPEGLGDTVIHDDQERWSSRQRNGLRYIKVYRPATWKLVAWEGFSYDVQFASALYGVTLTEKRNLRFRLAKGLDSRSLIPRDSVTGYKVGWSPYQGYGLNALPSLTGRYLGRYVC